MYRETKKHFNPPDAAQPFWIQLTGTSYCDYTYRISRTLAQSDVYVIEYIISGEGTININDQQYHPRAGDFYLLQPGTPHEYYSSADRPWVKIFANVYGPLCRHVISTYGLEQTILVRDCDVQDKLQNFINTANSLELTESQIMIRCAALFVEIIAMASAVKNSDREPGSNAEADKLRDYINANTQRTLNINDLAKLVYRSPDYVIKLFKKTFGCTPYYYQIQQKIEICKRRLCDSDDSVAEIAADLGYSDPQHFSKLFKSKCGMSPREYRKCFLDGKKENITW